MAYVITQACCNDASCVDVCPVDCIHPRPDEPGFETAEMLYIDPLTCIDCGACLDECPVEAISEEHELREDHQVYPAINAAYFERHPISGIQPEPVEQRLQSADLGTLRVAIVGSGPAACYAAIALTAHPRVEVDMFERLPTPYGLVRAGVAPDHGGTKAVTDVFRLAMGKRSVHCHFNVEVGRHISHGELLDHHHAVIYSVGASSDRRLAIPGEDLPGSHPAAEFVAWYNGHPDHAHHTFDLSGERAVIIGNGNVALDVARILLTDPDVLAATDMAQHAVQALRHSNIREVVIVGRRGPAQAAYTNPELIALGQLADVDIVVDPLEVVLDPTSRAWIDGSDSEPSEKLKVRQVEEFSTRAATCGGRKRIVLRYLASPEEIIGDGRVEQVRLVRNELIPAYTENPESFEGPPVLAARAISRTDTLDTGLVLRAIGYRGRPVPDLPFDERRAVVPNENGRVLNPHTGVPIRGVYVAGWIKRGPAGVIGTNKHCSAATVDMLLSDFTNTLLTPPAHDHRHLDTLIAERQPDVVDFPGWQRIDKHERADGKASKRLRTKIIDIATMLDVAHGQTN